MCSQLVVTTQYVSPYIEHAAKKLYCVSKHIIDRKTFIVTNLTLI